ncbi:hypothetical protein L13192_04733 [Pyrenophora tritici-repentis]|uniref:Uncharacterized protein n=1 Tax=Pyrenophora tritici-repentis TaxID=45151 RepID=A0A922NLY1_9PLEO|nr:hypothetical protein Ptr86124_004943 [Pyrenophora tritici-repentis]KAI1671376.1 hypothetical protein L13192_04733 [Pyrenophora tritici-repentis]KAI1685193.1 hypothetical protein KJE20_05477 [Pyrenophora tritici-repentis]
MAAIRRHRQAGTADTFPGEMARLRREFRMWQAWRDHLSDQYRAAIERETR